MRYKNLSNVIVRVVDNFHARYEFSRSHIKRETIFLQLSLVFIVLLSSLLRFEGAFEFNWSLSANDPYSQLIAAQFLNNQINKVGLIGALTKWLTFVDPLFWYPHPGSRNFGATQHIGTALTAIVTKDVFFLFGMNLSVAQAAYIAPAFCGSLSVIVIYFLGKELGNKRIGLLTGFFYAFNPGNLQRSNAGFFSNEAVGMLLCYWHFTFSFVL